MCVLVPYVLLMLPANSVSSTLSNTSIQAAELPEAFVKRLPRYPVLPATLLDRLAVDAPARRWGLGRFLAVVVEAKGDAAIQFYARHEFLRLPDQCNHLFKPIAGAFSSRVISLRRTTSAGLHDVRVISSNSLVPPRAATLQTRRLKLKEASGTNLDQLDCRKGNNPQQAHSNHDP
jgi:hypothetical protein